MVSEATRPVDGSPADGPRRGLEILAVSDDLTGAAALAGEFRAAGLASWVAPAEHAATGALRAEALVVDSRSRHLAPDRAAREVARALDRRDAPPGSLYKRIDSALRGNVTAELDAVAGLLARPVVLATAAPALGVVTRNGVQHAVAEGAARGARLASLVPGGAAEISLEQVRGWGLGRLLTELVTAGRHVVCDAESTADLARVASALVPLADRAVPVGSYGFGRAWASAVAGPRVVPPGSWWWSAASSPRAVARSTARARRALRSSSTRRCDTSTRPSGSPTAGT
jgi:4-hydroxythreonine-4-phosphate dehydrogenase